MNASPPADNRSEPPAKTSADALELRRRSDVLVVRPLGALDRSSLPRIRHAILGAQRPVVLDLDGCVLVRPSDLLAEDLDPGTRAVPDLRIACSRLSCRRLLARVGAGERYGIYESVDDALHSLRSPLMAGAEVTAGADGRAAATLDVHGHVCSATAAVLHAEVCRLVADGIHELSVRLGALDGCAIHGADAPQRGERPEGAADTPSDIADEVVAKVFEVIAGGDHGILRSMAVGLADADSGPPKSGRVTGAA